MISKPVLMKPGLVFQCKVNFYSYFLYLFWILKSLEPQKKIPKIAPEMNHEGLQKIEKNRDLFGRRREGVERDGGIK